MLDYPRNVIWYVEARDARWTQSEPQMGSAVAVWLRPAADPSRPRKYLLTCRHVIREADSEGNAGCGPLRSEILCWQPGRGYTPPHLQPGRASGVAHGAFAARVLPLDPSRPASSEVPADERYPARDWVLLDVLDPVFQSVEVVTGWAEVAEGARLDLYGYPNGAAAWQDSRVVECVKSEDFQEQRLAAPGTLRLGSAASTAPGMSGGGIFDKQGRLVGIHRSQTAAQLEFGAIRATAVRELLAAHGWDVVQTPGREVKPDPRLQPTLMVDIDRSTSPDSRQVSYKLQRRDGELCISPHLEYLDLVEKGGPIEPISYHWTPFEPALPVLDLKIVNNTSATVFFSEAVLQVESSRLDPRPLLVLEGRGHDMYLPLRNLGFGPASTCKVRFALAPLRDEEEAGPEAASPLPFEVDATAALERGSPVDLGPAFASLGVDVTLLRQDAPFPEDPQAELARLQPALGPFRDGLARVRGEIAYTGVDRSGNPLSKQLAFRAVVALLPPLPAAPLPPSAEYDAQLEVDKDDYQVSVSTPHVLKPGEADRFTIRLAAPKASWHRFKLRLYYNGGELVESAPIELLIFLTTADVDLVRRRSAPQEREDPAEP